VRAARAMSMATRVAGDEEGNGNGDDANINICFFFSEVN
jgi:hypothetical protein